MNLFNKIVFLFLLFGANSFSQDVYTLKDALSYGKKHSPTLVSEQLEIEISKSDLISAKLRPNFNFNFESIQIIDSKEYAPGTRWGNSQNRETLWELSKPIQWFGQRKNQIGLAQESVKMEEQNYSDIEREILFEIAEKWVEVWTLQMQQELLETAKVNSDSLKYLNQKKFENEVITHTDYLRIELMSKQFDMQYKKSKLLTEKSQIELGHLLGKANKIQAEGDLDFVVGLVINDDSIFSNATDYRADFQKLKTIETWSERNIKTQKSFAYPQPEIGVVWNHQTAVPFLGLSFSIDLPFFDRNQGEIKKSHIINEQVQHELHFTKNKIDSEVNIARSNYYLNKQNFEDYQPLLEQSEIILKNVRTAYLKGGTTVVDYLEAQRSWLETQENYYETLQDYVESYLKLLYTVGLINQLAL